jgi:hypothetical protein
METALPILLFLGFLLGSMVLILICGMQRPREDEDDAPEELLQGLDLQAMPRFFGQPKSRLLNPVMVVVDEPMVRQLEEFLQRELELAEVFVGDPSLEHLHSRLREDEAGPRILERVEQYLRSEQQAVADFVSHPSIESLHDRFAPLPLAV